MVHVSMPMQRLPSAAITLPSQHVPRQKVAIQTNFMQTLGSSLPPRKQLVVERKPMPKKNYQTPTLVSEEVANVLDTMKPRLKASVVARLSGLSQRAITQHAANNRIPGAAKHGGLWTFDHDLALQWIKEGSTCQSKPNSRKTSSNRKPRNSTGSASRSTATPTESLFEQHLFASRKKEPRAA